MNSHFTDKNNIFLTLWCSVLWFALFSLGVSYAYADSVHISNSISVQSNTGGNTARDGEVIEGKARGSVLIETIVDDEVVERIEESKEADGGSVEVRAKSSVTDTTATSSVSIEIKETRSQQSHSRPEPAQSESKEVTPAPSSEALPHATSSAAEALAATNTLLISTPEEATTSLSAGTQSSSVVTHVIDFFASLVTYVTTIFSPHGSAGSTQILCSISHSMFIGGLIS